MLIDELKKVAKVLWLLPGVLLFAAFPPLGERIDCCFALAPLMWLSRREHPRPCARWFFLNGLVFYLATLSWMPAIVKNGGPAALVVLGWGALAAYCSLYFWLYGWLSAQYWRWVKLSGNPSNQTIEQSNNSYWKRLLGILLVEPILWCGLELVRSRLFGGFAWNQLGVVPVNSGFGAPAAIGGVYLCSAVVVLINGTIAGIAERMWKPEQSGFAKLKRLGPLETLLAFGMVAGIYSQNRWNWRADGGGERGIKVALMQRNFPCAFSSERQEDPVAVYERLLSPTVPVGPELVVLPESAMCEFGPIDGPCAIQFAQWVSQTVGGTAVLSGGSRHADGREFNSAALYGDLGDGPRSISVDCYDKVHLVPFGEFIPGDKLFPALQRFAPVGSCTPGELKLLPLSTSTASLRLGCAICFEDTDSAQIRKLAKMGADALFFITNDSWFSRSVEPEQHAWQAVARAIETGLPVVRVGNSGVTGTITPDGTASWLSDERGRVLVDRAASMCEVVRIRDDGKGGSTPYVRMGDAPLALAFALTLAFFGIGMARGRRGGDFQ